LCGQLSREKRKVLELTSQEQAMLAGDNGPAVQVAMRIVVKMAGLFGAASLLPVSRAHIDSGIYEGQSGLDFVEMLLAKGARVAVPTSMNVVSLDLERWQENSRVPLSFATPARRLAQAYLKMGAKPTFTCAPYQLKEVTPRFGEQVAWAESNAVAFVNSVVGARTNKYGDFFDICLALTGRVPAYGLHLAENRRGQILLRLKDVPLALLRQDAFYQVLGYLVGRLAGTAIPVIEGLPTFITEDQLKAFSAAAASSGTVALFHIAGVTPEAPDLATAFGGNPPGEVIDITMDMLRRARQELSVNPDGHDRPDVIALGSPHFSLAECLELAGLVEDRRVAPGLEFFVATNRVVYQALAARGLLAKLTAFGANVTQDTCVVVSPLIAPGAQLLMTNSAKYAYYAPGKLNMPVVFGTLAECVDSAVSGRLVRDDTLWN
jgi:predicted aconitase